jgi:PKD repeat protein
MRFSNDNATWTPWEDYATSKTWQLSAGDGAKTVYVQLKDNHGLNSSIYYDTIILDIKKPIARAGNDQTVEAYVPVVFDASASTDENGIISYTWTFTDTTQKTLNGKNPTYTFISPGTYTVKLTVQDPAGNTNTQSITITVRTANNQPPSNNPSEPVPLWVVGILIAFIGVASTSALLIIKRFRRKQNNQTI